MKEKKNINKNKKRVERRNGIIFEGDVTTMVA